MRGSTQHFISFLILALLIISVFGSLILIAGGIPTVQHECIAIQGGAVSDLKFKVEEASRRGISIYHSFDILDCVKCIWYDQDYEQLVIVYSIMKGFLKPKEEMVRRYNISTQFANIGCNCNSCDEKVGEFFCANLKSGEDSPYALKINKTHIDCIDCPETFKSCKEVLECENYNDDGKDACQSAGCYWCDECLKTPGPVAESDKIDTCVFYEPDCGYHCEFDETNPVGEQTCDAMCDFDTNYVYPERSSDCMEGLTCLASCVCFIT